MRPTEMRATERQRGTVQQLRRLQVVWPGNAMIGGMTVAEARQTFRQLHRPGEPLVMPNAWDAGSARLLAALGAAAIATTSSGFAATLGRPDGGVNADEAIDHVEALVAASPVPVSADLEDCFHAEPAGVADTIRRAVDAGSAGGSVEDFTRADGGSIYELGLATERVAAAVEAAAGTGFVLTARAENLIRGVDDLADT
ncbi:MAG: isocitrate lyase/phosphoenolpyruvate mutase family protein, partial [Ilumatobacteraceae bacterium]